MGRFGGVGRVTGVSGVDVGVVGAVIETGEVTATESDSGTRVGGNRTAGGVAAAVTTGARAVPGESATGATAACEGGATAPRCRPATLRFGWSGFCCGGGDWPAGVVIGLSKPGSGTPPTRDTTVTATSSNSSPVIPCTATRAALTRCPVTSTNTGLPASRTDDTTFPR